MEAELRNLEQLLDRICQAADHRDEVTLDAVLKRVGTRSFGPLLLTVGIITLSPLTAIPGMPTSMAILVFLLAVQLLFGRDCFWLPGWLLKRSISREKVDKAARWLRRPARFVDRWLRPRMGVLATGAGLYAIGIVCLAIATLMPMMELVPFSVHGAGAALTAFGIALIAHDGLFALVAFLITTPVVGLALYHLINSVF